MRLLFLSYWGMEDPLSHATVLPHVRILASLPQVQEVVLACVERGVKRTLPNRPEFHKVNYVPLHWNQDGLGPFGQIIANQKVKQQLRSLLNQQPFDLVIARSTMAGDLVYSACIQHKIPYVIESLEPHTDYMVEAGVWSAGGLKARYMRRSEQRQLRYAFALLPLSRAYAAALRSASGVTAPIHVMPCCVDFDRFTFQFERRQAMRRELGCAPAELIGVYVGKFGGIYMQKDALNWFQYLFKTEPGFRLLILSGDPDSVLALFRESGIPMSRTTVLRSPPERVPDYLWAADVAFSLHLPTPSKLGISPIKNAEYLAAGLPVLSPVGIGDDPMYLEENGLGVVLSPWVESAFPEVWDRLKALIGQGDRRERADRARPERDLRRVHDTYMEVLSAL